MGDMMDGEDKKKQRKKMQKIEPGKAINNKSYSGNIFICIQACMTQHEAAQHQEKVHQNIPPECGLKWKAITISAAPPRRESNTLNLVSLLFIQAEDPEARAWEMRRSRISLYDRLY